MIILAVLLGIAGLAGSVLPALPGPPLGYAGMILIHLAHGRPYSTSTLVIFGLLTAAALAVDYAFPALGAKAYGASRYGVIGSAVGMIVGLIIFQFIGMMAGMFLGAVIGEYMAGKETGQALRSGAASFVGGVSAMLFKLGVSIIMLFMIVKAIL